MKILLVLDAASERLNQLEHALALRGHRASCVAPERVDGQDADLTSADLVIADAEVVARHDLVEKVAASAPSTEFIVVGSRGDISHPHVIEQLGGPLDVDRLLSIVDEVADVLDTERMHEPVELVAYETLFAGDSPQIRDLLRRVRLVAGSAAPVCVFGDDGSGRPIIARAIHDRSARRKGPFLSYNCAAHTDEELCRRLFDGANAAIQQARNGSLFIERIAVAGPNTQRELIGYLEGHVKDSTSVRLIIGVNRDRIRDGAPQLTAADLFYRLKVLEIEIPSLKERSRDLPQIIARMLSRLAPGRNPPTVTNETMQLLERYSFPGNLLELAHALTHGYVLAAGESIQPRHLPISIRQATSEAELARMFGGELEALDVVAKRFERDYLLRVLRSVEGNRGQAAEILGLSRKGLWGKLKAHGISDDDIEDDAS